MNLWKRKLAAFLHDPPSKCLEIVTHEEHARTLFRQAGFSPEEAESAARQFAQPSDWTASAADRLPFPASQASGLSCKFDGCQNQFHHPLGPDPERARFQFDSPFSSTDLAREIDQSVQPVLQADCLAELEPIEAWRARFFTHWRLWQRHAAATDYRFALLPADTRIPDHTVWTHMQVVSALDTCADRPGRDAVLSPAFLKFQIGPVQEFIAAARSIRDLWSGSYLLSWLMAAGLKALSEQVGPDAVIFPNLREQPLFDLHWRDELWSKVRIGSDSVWNSIKVSDEDVLTPNLPNVFLAVVPANRASELADCVESAIRKEWAQIADSAWNFCDQARLTADEADLTRDQRRERFDAQVSKFLSLSWRATPWPDSLQEALKLAADFAPGTPIAEARCRVEAVVKMAQDQMPRKDRDRRFYTDETKSTLNNVGLGWSVALALNAWELDAVRQTRHFNAATAGGWQVGTFNNKDSLTGRDEAVAGGKTWGTLAREVPKGPWKFLFKHDDWLSAPTLIKRVWHLSYLGRAPWNLKTSSNDFPMPDTRNIARHAPFQKDDDDHNANAFDSDSSETYFAVLALDGDQIGKWISGEKTPAFASQLADYCDGSGSPGFGALPYFQSQKMTGFLASKRPLSPSYHLQFSEALGNFALRCARTIVEAFDGRLIYAGGDDVLALLPADTALGCAQALRDAFQGRIVSHPSKGKLLDSPAPGFLNSDSRDRLGKSLPLLVPGPNADCSVGIAIAHFKSPLQDIVRAAQAAEKRAKKDLGRGAVAVTLTKRSGEIVKWGTKWGPGLELYRQLAEALEAGQLSAKFPHRFAELLEPYLTEATPLLQEMHAITPTDGFPVAKVVREEFTHCLSRQHGPHYPSNQAQAQHFLASLHDALEHYLTSLGLPTDPPDPADQPDPSHPPTPPTDHILRSLLGLCQTVAFAHRTTATPGETQPKGT
jgi:CRISPR-associated protein Cmr2